MKTSCIRHPENSTYLQVHDWMTEFCQENHCAVLLLAFLAGWHDYKIRHDKYYQRCNDIAETHGDGRPHSENAYLYFTMEELIAGIRFIYGSKAINTALDFLVTLNVISIHKNPNPRYYFDKTKYFVFFADVCNEWIAETYPVVPVNRKKALQVVDINDNAKTPYGKGEKVRVPSKKAQPAGEKVRHITNTTIYTTNNNQIINENDDFLEDEDAQQPSESLHQPDVEVVINLLTSKGLPPKQCGKPDDVALITDLLAKGATPDLFAKGYDIADETTRRSGKRFGLRYLAKVVEGLLTPARSSVRADKTREPQYQERIPASEEWAHKALNQEDSNHATRN